jgi:hypothetical protein
MRLWSLHPQYLDPAGLVALWREGILAQAVLRGETKGYTRHPQLQRFRETPDPVAAINSYLYYVFLEARVRQYNFDVTKIDRRQNSSKIIVPAGQLDYERQHLQNKLRNRNPNYLHRLPKTDWQPHPVVKIIPGGIADWERLR